MPRTSRNPRIINRSQRSKLAVRRDPYWHLIAESQHLGYRKGTQGGTWIARLYEPSHGRRFRALGVADDAATADGISILSFSQAQEIARSWFAEVHHNDTGDVRTGPYTVQQASEAYLADRERAKRKRLDATRAVVTAHILPSLGSIELSQLTHSRIKSWRDAITEANPRVRTKHGATEPASREIDKHDPEIMRRRQATANRILTVLKAILNHAHENKHIASKAAWEAIKPFRKVDLPKVRFLKPHEATALIDGCAPDFQLLVKAALLTGCRYGELASLRVESFDPINETIFVTRSKSGEARHVSLNAEGVAFFATLAQQKPSYALIFVRSNGEPWSKSQQKRPMDAACVNAKLNAVTFHILRHTYASQAVMNGVPIAVVAEQLGHKDTRITERHYAHLCPSYKREIIRTHLPNFLTATPASQSVQ